MKSGIVRLAALISGLFISISVPAQDLPVLPADGAVKSAVLPDGLTCYVAANKAVKGFADYALVSKEDEKAVVYLKDVMTADEQKVDSTLLSLMRYVENSGRPAAYALIACGDLDAGSILHKLKYMSYMIPSGEPAGEVVYDDGELTRVSIRTELDTVRNISTVYAEWTSPRTPENYMNTVQKAVYDKTIYELRVILCQKIRMWMESFSVPVADVELNHRSSLDGRGPEMFSLRMCVAPDEAARAENVLRDVLAETDAIGASAADLKLAESDYFDYLSFLASHDERSNENYMKRCISAYLYNASLSSVKDRLSFFRSKVLPDKVREDVFSGVASALIDINHSAVMGGRRYLDLSDTLSFPGPGEKIKVRSDKKDQISGGRVWTFANGFKVVYKRMPTSRTLYYSLALKGGYGMVADLSEGEGAFMSDYLDLCYISGLKGKDFKDVLRLSGMTMDEQVGLSDIVISGEVSDRNLPLMMKALLAAMNERSIDNDAVAYYSRCEHLRMAGQRGTSRDLKAAIDSLMCPGYKYSFYKASGHLYDDTMKKAEGLFDKVSRQMNDGVLVIVGDMDELDVKKMLQMYVGGFRTQDYAFHREEVHYQPVSGTMTYTIDGDVDLVAVALSARLPMTADNYAASDIASMYLENVLMHELSPMGVKVGLSHSRLIYPEDRYSVMLRIQASDGAALPQDILHHVRLALEKAFKEQPSAAYVSSAKSYLKNIHSLDVMNPEYWLEAIATRHLDGKDFTTGYAAKTDAVTAAKVNEILQLLDKGPKLEYVIKR